MSVDHKSDNSGLPDAPISERAREEAIFKAVSAFEARQHNQEAPARFAVRTGVRALLLRRDFQAVTATALVLIMATPVGFSLLHPQQEARTTAPAIAPVQTERVEKAESASTEELKKESAARLAEAERKQAVQQAPQKMADAKAIPEAAHDALPRRADGMEPVMQAAPFPASPSANRRDAQRLTRSPQKAAQLEGFDGTLSFEIPRKSRMQTFGYTQRPTLDSGNYATPVPGENRDRFANADSNGFKQTISDAVSTFSIDADTASYSYMRAALADNALPRPDAVRTEELINYFPYDYTVPSSAREPFAADVSVMPHPWAAGRKLVRLGIKGYQLAEKQRPPANLVFLIDTSGSMAMPNKLPLLLKSLAMLVDTLRPTDRVAIVAYAGSAGVVLEPTPVLDKQRILASLDRLSAGGSTAGGEGLQLAYKLAKANYAPEAVNRVMLATDGDFNVGITSNEALKGFVERERQSGIFLSVLGFGMGNLNDSLMQTLAQNGNGVAAQIDTLAEARKVLVEEASSSLFPIAKDVKIQVEFNPATVSEYRLVGYETRLLKQEDFNNDKVDAGEVGSGASVTAIYDIVPKGAARQIDESRYKPSPQTVDSSTGAEKTDEYAFLKIRYKLPDSQTSTLMTRPITLRDEVKTFAQAPQSARFAVAVAGFGELLRGNGRMGDVTFDSIIQLANAAKGDDVYGYRAEFVSLVRAAKMAKSLPNE